MKKILFAGIIIIALAALWFTNAKTSLPSYSSTPTPAVSVKVSPTPTATPKSPSPVPSSSPVAGTFTMAQVAAHNTAASCYTVVSGVVYDLTSFIAKHPGGEANIMSICGIDGTSAFENQHGGQGRPESTLATLKIGVLAR